MATIVHLSHQGTPVDGYHLASTSSEIGVNGYHLASTSSEIPVNGYHLASTSTEIPVNAWANPLSIKKRSVRVV